MSMVRDLDFEIGQNLISLCLMGRNGVGKTTISEFSILKAKCRNHSQMERNYQY